MSFASPDEARANWLAGLAAQDATLSREILAVYGRTREALMAALARLQRDIALSPDPVLRADQVARRASWQAFLADMAREFRVLEPLVMRAVTDGTRSAIEAGAQAGLEMALGVARPDAGISIAAGWNRPDIRALREMADTLAAQVAGRVGVGKFADAASQKVADMLLAGMAAGYNPRRTAGIAAQAFNVPLTWALTTARTAQIYAYRRGSHAAYRANPTIVAGWIWLAACDRRTCPGCFAMHGTRHGHDKELNDHHNGRCCPMPDLAGLSAYQSVTSGESRFRQLSEADQRQVLGPRLYDAWRGGHVNFRLMSRTYTDPVYGTMRRAATARELGLAWRPTGVTMRVRSMFAPHVLKHDVFRETTAAIDRVHRVTMWGTRPISGGFADFAKRFPGNEDATALYNTHRPLTRIWINTAAPLPLQHFSLAHEIGHAIDFLSFGRGRYVSEDVRDARFAAWRRAIARSQAVADWQTDPMPAGLRAYVLSTTELWARSYAQWVAIRSADPRLLEGLGWHLRIGWQWDITDFDAIAAALDRIFGV